jgi:hypothetical protein
VAIVECIAASQLPQFGIMPMQHGPWPHNVISPGSAWHCQCHTVLATQSHSFEAFSGVVNPTSCLAHLCDSGAVSSPIGHASPSMLSLFMVLQAPRTAAAMQAVLICKVTSSSQQCWQLLANMLACTEPTRRYAWWVSQQGRQRRCHHSGGGVQHSLLRAQLHQALYL